MDIVNCLLGYKLTCKMLDDTKGHLDYEDGEFVVIIK